jgi:integrase/recombinase XerD
MKIDRHGQAKILTQAEIQLLFSQGLENNCSRALFGICLYCCCRINEACTLSVTDVYDRAGKARAELLPSRQKNTYFRSGSKAIAKTGSAKKLEYKYLAVLGHSEKIKIKAD